VNDVISKIHNSTNNNLYLHDINSQASSTTTATSNTLPGHISQSHSGGSLEDTLSITTHESSRSYEKETLISPSAMATLTGPPGLITPRKKHAVRHYYAPPGKLGVIIDSHPRTGPIVHEVRSTSPLLGLLRKGDRIIAVDDVDVREMTANRLMRFMIDNSEKRRKVTVLSMIVGSVAEVGVL